MLTDKFVKVTALVGVDVMVAAFVRWRLLPHALGVGDSRQDLIVVVPGAANHAQWGPGSPEAKVMTGLGAGVRSDELVVLGGMRFPLDPQGRPYPVPGATRTLRGNSAEPAVFDTPLPRDCKGRIVAVLTPGG